MMDPPWIDGPLYPEDIAIMEHAADMELLWHSLGIKSKDSIPYRNHFAAATNTDDYRRCERLAAAGLMLKGDDLGYGHLFHVTDAGKVKARV